MKQTPEHKHPTKYRSSKPKQDRQTMPSEDQNNGVDETIKQIGPADREAEPNQELLTSSKEDLLQKGEDNPFKLFDKTIESCNQFIQDYLEKGPVRQPLPAESESGTGSLVDQNTEGLETLTNTEQSIPAEEQESGTADTTTSVADHSEAASNSQSSTSEPTKESDFRRENISDENSNINLLKKSEDNSISFNSKNNSRVQKNAEYVQGFKGCVQSLKEYVQDSTKIRAINGQNTCNVCSEGLQCFSQYVLIHNVEYGKVKFTIDESKSLHFVALCFDARLTVDEESAFDNVFGSASNNVYRFMLESDHDTQQLIDHFLRQYPRSHLITSIPEEKLSTFKYWLEKAKVIPRRWLEGNTLLRRHLLTSNQQRMLWDNDFQACLKKVVTYFSRQKKNHSI